MKRLAVVLGAAALATVSTVGISSSQTAAPTIRTIGRNTFIRNALIQSTFRFAPERLGVASGRAIVLRNPSNEPHTLSIVGRKQRPSTVQEVFGCRVCRNIKPNNNVGRRGLNRVGDSFVVQVGDSATRRVTAPAGKTLYYLCLFHPWMQGKIFVR